MSTPPVSPSTPPPGDGAARTTAVSTTETSAEYIPAQAIERLPKEIPKDVIIGIAALIKSNSGPDPESAKAMAEAEMHSEKCRLEGYKEQLDKRDKQSGRDHEYRMKRLKYDTQSGHVFNFVCLLGIAFGLYIYVAMHDITLGTNLMTGCFVALLGPKALLQKSKE